MKKFLVAATMAALLAGCSTQPAAPVEDQSAAAAAAAAKDGAATSGTTTSGVSGSATGTGANPLKDPNNILSKRSIFYDFDKFDVRDEYRGLVEAHAKYLRDNPGAKMLIQGNTDERGSREYNVGLGQRRSDGVKKMLVLLGARDNQIESVSLGEEKPQAEGHDESAWSKNRRSDILYSGEY